MATKTKGVTRGAAKVAAVTPEDAVKAIRGFQERKFDESVEIHVRLGVNPTKAEENVRGAVVLPAGLGKTVRVVVIAQGEKVIDAKNAGADEAGGADIIEKIAGGWMDFETLIATPDMMGQVAKVGKLLGPRGLMPNPKTGTVTFDVTTAVREAKAGKVEYRVDKGSNVHASLGKRSFTDEALLTNLRAFMDAIVRARPAAVKGAGYLRKITLSTTMGASVQVDVGIFK